jgi:hypothetical protein
MAFALTMLILFVALTILLLGMLAPSASLNTGLLGSTTNSGKFAANNMNAVQAFNLAESGVDYTIEYLHQLSAPPTNSSAFAPAIWGSTSVGNPARSVVTMTVDPVHNLTGTFSVEVYPASGNGSTTQKKYLIESIGTYNGVTELVSAYIEQASFGQYAYFNDEEEQNGYWVAGSDSFDGPMHSNNVNPSDPSHKPGTLPTNILWYQNSADTMFTYDGADAFSCVSSTIAWNLNSVGNTVGPQSTTDWTDVAVGGGSTIATGQADVPLPSNSTVEMSAALGGTTAPSGSTPQVVIPNSGGGTSGGIYINGNVNEMAFGTADNGVVQTVTITQTNTATNPNQTIVTTVTMDPTQNTTTISTATTPNGGATTTTSTSYSGTTNGVVYVNGNVGTQYTGSQYADDATDAWNSGDYYFGQSGNKDGSNVSTYKSGGVHGVIADNYYNATGTLVHASGITLATNSSDNLNFDGSLTTNTQRQQVSGTYVPESSDPNFLSKAGTLGVVSNNVEVVQNSYTGAALNTMEIDGAVLAYSTFDADDIYGRSVGNFTVMGGYIAEEGGYFGVMDWSGNMLAGFHEHYHYDARLENNPPPFFPTTGNQYTIVSWTRQNGASTMQ